MIDLLCSDPWACNMGDVATALCTANELAKRNIATRRVSHYQNRPTIIGGGDLMSHQEWYLPSGGKMLNAVGVREPIKEPDRLKDCQYISVRDDESANMIGIEGVKVVPCPATLIDPLPWEIATQVPRCGGLSTIGDYIVIHARNELYGFANGEHKYEVVAIEPAPYTWEPWEAKGWRLPMTHSPEFIAAVVKNAQAVITLSLHMSVIALAMGTPFCVPTRGNADQSAKLKAYWERAGFPEVIYDGVHPVKHALELSEKMIQVQRSEIQSATKHVGELAITARMFDRY